MNDEELRDQLTKSIENARLDVTWAASPADDVWTCDTANGLADALMPVVREALAEAWDDGADNEASFDTRDNPWRVGD